MRVNLVTSPYAMCGLSRYTVELSESLPKLGFETSVIETVPPRWLNAVSALTRRVGPDFGAFWGTYPLQVGMNGSGVYHLTHPGLATCLYLSRAERVVVTVHDIIHYVHRGDRELSTYQHIFHRMADALGLRALRKASAIIAISQHTKAALVEHLGCAPAKIHVVHRSVNLDRFRPLRVEDDFWVRHGLDPDARYVLHLSSEEPRKNVETLLRAFASVASERADVRLLKIGRSQYPDCRLRLLQLVNELGLGERVTFIDYVTDEDLPRFYSVADVFVLPSLYEGFGLPVLEAMACGCPTVCSSRAPLPEVVGDAGKLCDPECVEELAEAISRVCADSVLREAMSARGIQRARMFSSESEAQRTSELYEVVNKGISR